MIAGRPPIEAGPRPRRAVDQQQAHMAGAPWGPQDVADVDTLPRERAETQASPEVGTELADVARAEAEASTRHHRRRRHPAALDVELEERGLRVGLGMAVDHTEEIEGVRAQSDDVDHARAPTGRHDDARWPI